MALKYDNVSVPISLPFTLSLVGLVVAACTLISLLALPLWVTVTLATIATAAVISGEMCERLLYFGSVVYDRMPGILR